MMRAARIAACALAALLVGAQAPAPDAVIAQSGTLTVTAGDARRLLDNADPDLRQQAQHDAMVLPRLVRAQMLQALLLNEARAKQWDQRPDVIFRANQAHDGVIANSYLASQTTPPADYPSDADVQAAYEANKPRFMLPRQYQLAQIFIAVPAGAARTAEDDAQKRIRDIRQALAKPHADFAAIARRQSEDHASADKGGDLGWLREDGLVAPIRDAVASLPDNAVSDPIRATDGWHIIRMEGTRPAAPAPLADVRDQIVRALRQQRMAQNERALVDELLRRQPIQLDEIQLQRLSQSPTP
jgi:parvulin-like peptidyl-prolyl isomerase